jgi:hypothetical protein
LRDRVCITASLGPQCLGLALSQPVSAVVISNLNFSSGCNRQLLPLSSAEQTKVSAAYVMTISIGLAAA